MTEERHDDRAPRRQLLKKLAAGGSVASLAAMPGKWAKPVVASVILPAHAQTSPQGCVGTLGNCPPGYFYSDSDFDALNLFIDPSDVTNDYPGITYSDGSLSGSAVTQKYVSYGPCPSPCDNAVANKYFSASAEFGNQTASYGVTIEARCGDDAILRFSYDFTGTYSGTAGSDRVYSGNASYSFESCYYLYGGLERQRRSRPRVLRNFRFGN